MPEIIWETPSNFGNTIEGDFFESPLLVATYDGSSSGISYSVQNPEELPQNLELDENQISGIILEMDDYVEEFLRPEDFSYDSGETSGYNYARYGSGLARTKTFSIIIRATLEGFMDSNGMGLFTDQTFTLTVLNNYSSDRDSFIREYFKDETLDYEGNQYNVEEFLTNLKNDGYYL